MMNNTFVPCEFEFDAEHVRVPVIGADLKHPGTPGARVWCATTNPHYLLMIVCHAKRKTYYHRSYVPKAIRQLLHERFEIWRSLDTLDKKVVH